MQNISALWLDADMYKKSVDVARNMVTGYFFQKMNCWCNIHRGIPAAAAVFFPKRASWFSQVILYSMLILAEPIWLTAQKEMKISHWNC